MIVKECLADGIYQSGSYEHQDINILLYARIQGLHEYSQWEAWASYWGETKEEN